MKRKQEHRAAVRARLTAALQDLYHNATVNYPRELYGRTDDYFQSWFEDQAQWEIEYIGDGGATGNNYAATLAHPANGGKLASAAARAYYIRKGMQDRDEERADCGAVTGWSIIEMRAGDKRARARLGPLLNLRESQNPASTRNNAQWERISEYGKLYQHGRGGRTLAPADLWGGRGCKVDPDEMGIPACVDMLRVLESFNAYVRAWCDGVPDMWREHCEDEDREALAEKRAAAARKGRETRERNYWNARDCATV